MDTTPNENQHRTTSRPDGPGEGLRLTVISGSVRDDRVGADVARWAADGVARTGALTTVIDLAEVDLPDDARLQPGGGARSRIATVLDDSDGFVVVTPEYNHSYPGSLKRAIDWHYSEWMFKAASVVSYGAQGGLLATEHLRGVFAELHVVTTRRVVGLHAPWSHVDGGGYTAPPGIEDALDRSLDELCWWSGVLSTARREHPFER